MFEPYHFCKRVCTTFASHSFSIIAPNLELLAFELVHTHSDTFLKPTVSSRHLVCPGGSHKSLRFGLWMTLHAVKDFTCLFIYFPFVG